MIHSLIKLIKLFNFIFIVFILSIGALAKERLVVGITTSTADSGLSTYLKINFEKRFNSTIDFIAQGTGQIINIAKNGDIDVLLVHHKKSEESFIKNEFGIKRYNLMYNDFVIVGPKQDYANIKNAKTLKEAMLSIFNTHSIFVSRADLSGTHYKELELWNNAGIGMNTLSDQYMKIGSGMGAALNFAHNVEGYTLTDRATWISFGRKDTLQILFKNKEKLINQYSLILVNSNKIDNINDKWGEVFIEWVLSNDGRELINNYKKNGEQLFFFNGDKYIRN